MKNLRGNIGTLVLQSYIDQEIKVVLLAHLQDYIEIMLRLLRYLSKISGIFRSNQKAGAFDVFGQAKTFVIFSGVALHSSKL